MKPKKRRQPRRGRRTRCVTDLGLDLDRIADRRAPRDWLYIDGNRPWSMVEHARARLGMDPCPVCGDVPLKPGHYCSACDRTSFDGQCEFPGLPVDAAPDPDYPRDGPAYRPGPLPGGKGESKAG